MDSSENVQRETLLDWTQRLCPDTPRKRLKQWIADGRFKLDGKVVDQAGLRLADPGERLVLGPPDSAIVSWSNRRKIHPKVTVLHMDAALAIIDKGAGLLSVPTDQQSAKSALEVLGDFLNDPKGEGTRRRIFGSASIVRPLPVHRLDQYTSGLFCLAFDDSARLSLIEQLQKGRLVREYFAIVDGIPEDRSGTWRHWLKLDSKGFRQQLFEKPVADAVEAVSHYTVEKVFPRSRTTRLRIRLETGLKHQIRIQAAAMGLPLVGDRLHNEKVRQGDRSRQGLQRQALHACLIELEHPVSGKPMRFSSEPPPDMKRING